MIKPDVPDRDESWPKAAAVLATVGTAPAWLAPKGVEAARQPEFLTETKSGRKIDVATKVAAIYVVGWAFLGLSVLFMLAGGRHAPRPFVAVALFATAVGVAALLLR